jgi:hypothetical protein
MMLCNNGRGARSPPLQAHNSITTEGRTRRRNSQETDGRSTDNQGCEQGRRCQRVGLLDPVALEERKSW